MNYNDEVQKKRANSKLQLKVIENKNNLEKNSNRKESLKNSDVNVSNEIFDPIKEEVMNKIFIENNCIYAIIEKYNPETRSIEETHKRLTNFLINYESKATFENQGVIKYIIKIEKGSYKQSVEMLSSSLVDSKSFKNFIAKRLGGEYIFNGNDNELNLLKEYLAYQEYKNKIGVEKLGFIKCNDDTYKFIDSSNELEEFQKQEDYAGLQANLFNSEEIKQEELKQLSKFLFDWNDRENTIISVLFPTCCLLSKKFDDIGIKLFHLFTIGERGSGKSTGIEDIIMPILGMDKNCLNKAGGTEFTGLKLVDRSNTFPVILEEFKPHKMSKSRSDSFSNLLRSSYDKQTDVRGRANQTLNKFVLTSPIIVGGEANINESAIQDRSINLDFHKLNHSEFGRNAINKIKKMKKDLTKLGRSILEIILNLNNKKLENMYFEHLEKTTKFKMNSRRQEHCAKLLVAFELFEKVYDNLGLNLQEECNININQFLILLQETQSDIESKSIVETTLELYDLNYRSLMEEWDFKFLADGEQIAIDIKGSYHKMTKFYKENGLDQEMLNIKDFTKQLRNSEYFVDYKSVKLHVAYEPIAETEDKKEAKKNKKCFILDCNKLKNNLDFENLL